MGIASETGPLLLEMAAEVAAVRLASSATLVIGESQEVYFIPAASEAQMGFDYLFEGPFYWGKI